MSKVSLIILTILLCFVIQVWAEEKEKKMESICPVTKMASDCLQCHAVIIKDGKPVFGLKEIRPDSFRVYPSGTRVINGKGYYLLDGEITTDKSNLVGDYFEYLIQHGIKYAIFDIHSQGGSLFSGWRIKGLIDNFEANGGIVETRMSGFAASAAAILFVAGTKGHRIANAQSELMFHELYSFKFIDISTPSDKEDEARVLRHLQDTISSWLATRGNMTKEDIDSRCRKRELWMNGKEAFEYGFADKLIGK